MSWTPTLSEQQLVEGKPVVVRCGPRQIALLRREGALLAFDNRCPHEGYPLSEGRVDDRCVLTCEWHNWKFDLADGRNLFGTDHLRVYPTRVDAGRVMVELDDGDAAGARAAALDSLKAAFDDRQYDRIARALARLHFEGLDPVPAVEQAIHWSADRFEYGMTHAYAATADWLVLYDDAPGEEPERRLSALVESIDHMAADSLRQPCFPFPVAVRPFDAAPLLEAVEAEDEGAAIAVLNGGLAAGLPFAALEGPLAAAALAHYRDYGHSLIYVQKVGALIHRLGDGVAPPLLRSLVRSLVYATREDLVPGFRGYAQRLATCAGREDVRRSPSAPLDPPTGLSVDRAMDRVTAWLGEHPPETAFAALVHAAGENLLRFETRFEVRADVGVSRSAGWLDFTHAVTFAAALRELAGRHPRLWAPGLLQLACFTGRVVPFLGADAALGEWRVSDPQGYFAGALDRILDHGLREPIFACHLLKTTLAARELLPHLPPAAATTLLAGTRRFLESPLKQKHVRRTMRQALSLVGLDYAGPRRAAG